MHCAPALLIVETNLSATFACWSVSVWLWLFWLDWAPIIIGSRNIWPIYKLSVSFSAPSPFFITFVLPQMCWRLALFFAAAWLGLFASICIFVVVDFCFSWLFTFVARFSQASSQHQIFMNLLTGPSQCAHQMIKCMMHGIKWIEQSCLTVVIILVILLPLVTFKQGTLEQKENGC